ncbi:hypothetical protein [Pseudomonas sp. Irchel 3E13]|jgi:ABC-type branched-subunit amino acid transport system permease subunit|uniref:hypothetical protein n=1 Tax=Pseudomonas sp. Irchel 3E13 TaxID=2008975 RepID=UPI00135CE9C7|nr:hypothetical protein [Pseudomonas sp. Irchel 3E13]
MSKVKYWAFTVGAVLSALSGAVVVWKGFTENHWYLAATPIYLVLAVSLWNMASRLRTV